MSETGRGADANGQVGADPTGAARNTAEPPVHAPPPPVEERLRPGTEAELLWRLWPGPAEPRGGVLLVHGLGEHLGRYGHVAEALNRGGFRVGGVDLRGHGLSAGKRGHVDRWADYANDLRLAAERLPDPLYLVAHSMGALAALDFLRDDRRVRGLALSGPLLGVAVQAPRWKTGLAGILSRLTPRLSLRNEIDAEEVCGNVDVVLRYEEDPLNFDTITPRWYVEMGKALERVHAHATQYRIPLLMMAGEADRVVCLRQMRDFLGRWGGPKEAQFWPGGRHEIFNEDFGPQVLDRLVHWLQDQPRTGSSPNSRIA